MGWLDRFAMAFGKEVAKEVNMSPEQKKQRKGQEEANRLGREFGTELTFIESFTQEEYEIHVNKEREQSIEALHREGERVVHRLQVFADHFLEKNISLTEMFDAYEKAEKTLFGYMIFEMNSNGLTYDEKIEIASQYHDKIFDIKLAVRL